MWRTRAYQSAPNNLILSPIELFVSLHREPAASRPRARTLIVDDETPHITIAADAVREAALASAHPLPPMTPRAPAAKVFTSGINGEF